MTLNIQWNTAAVEALFTDPIGPVGLALEELAVRVETTAEGLVRRPGSGKVYTRHGVAHQAAAPGDPFSAEDNDTLADSIGHVLTVDRGYLVARIGTDNIDGLFQEVGTRNMPAHPFLRPALMMVQGASMGDIRGAAAARSLGRALTAPTRERRAIRRVLTAQHREVKAARAIGRALSAQPRQQRREALAAKRIGKALKGLG